VARYLARASTRCGCKNSVCPQFDVARAEVAFEGSARSGLSREQWLQLEREPAYVPASVVTNASRSSFAPADPADIARIERLLRSEPGPEDLDPDTLRAALAQVKPGATSPSPTSQITDADPSTAFTRHQAERECMCGAMSPLSPGIRENEGCPPRAPSSTTCT
jgi:hypothetical protein